MDEPTTPTAPPTAADEVEVARSEDPRIVWLRDRLPVWLFWIGVVATVPLVLWVYGKDQWFLRDEWFFLSDPRDRPPLLEPSAGAHWVLVPRLAYAAMWEVWGVTTYKPYLLANVLLHLLAVVMLREVLRRTGVSAWLATAAASILLLFGPGSQGIVLAFQIGFTGSLAWGMVHLVVADSEGGFKRRDLLALGFGLLAITSSGVGVTTTLMVGLAMLLRRGWRMGLLHSVPLLAIYGIWARTQHVQSTTRERPTLGELFRWDYVTTTATFKGIGHFTVLAWAMVAVIVVGLALILRTERAAGWRDLGRRYGLPIAMLVSLVVFASITGVGRYWTGDGGARSSRYVYFQAFMLLPTIAVCAHAIARRWRRFEPVLVVLLLLPIPFNLGEFGGDAFNKAYFEHRRYILTTAVRMPFADEVPPDVRPVPDAFDSENLTIGFLLEAMRDGKLEPSTIPIDESIENEFRIRLGLRESATLDGIDLATCGKVTEPFELELEEGEVVGLAGSFHMHTIDEPGGPTTSRGVSYRPDLNGIRFEAVRPGLLVRVTPDPGPEPMTVCPAPT